MKQKQILGVLLFTLFWATQHSLTASEFKGHETDPEWGINFMEQRLPQVNAGTQKRLKQLFEDTYGANWDLVKGQIDAQVTTRAAGTPAGTARANAITTMSTDLTNLKTGANAAETAITNAGGAANVDIDNLIIYTNDIISHGLAGGKFNRDWLEHARGNLNSRIAGYVEFYTKVIAEADANADTKKWGATTTPNPDETEIKDNAGKISAGVKGVGVGYFSCTHTTLKTLFTTTGAAPISAGLRFEGWTAAKDDSFKTDAQVNNAIRNLVNGTLNVANAAFADDATYTAGHQAWFDTHLVATPTAPAGGAAGPAGAPTLFEALTAKITTLQNQVAVYAPQSTTLSPFAQSIKDTIAQTDATYGTCLPGLADAIFTNQDALDAANNALQFLGSKKLARATYFGPTILPDLTTTPDKYKATKINDGKVLAYFRDYWTNLSTATKTMKAGGAAAAAPALQPQLDALENALTRLNGSATELKKAADQTAAIPGTGSQVGGLGDHMVTELTNVRTALEAIYTALGNTGKATRIKAIQIPAP